MFRTLYRARSFGSAAISGIYFLFGFLWIFFSDKFLLSIVSDELTYARIQTWKGWIYVFLTTVLIFFLLRTYISIKNSAIKNLEIKEAELEDTLKEKEALIRELHHRVKNNLQMVESLIQLKKNSQEYREPEILLAKIEEQLYTLSLIHEKVFIHNKSLYINMSDFIDDISGSVVDSHRKIKKIELLKQIEDCSIPLDTALPYGLIISEALSNSVKHAFVGRKDGQIRIVFSFSNGRYFLDISDNGCGFDPENLKNRYGIDLIMILAAQLGVSASITSIPDSTIIRIE